MYTILPLPVVDTVNDHGGFFFLAVLVFAIVMFIWASLEDSYDTSVTPYCILLYLALMAWPAWESWHSGTITVPKNEKVTVHMVDFWGESHSETRKSGKTTQQVEVHNQYVSYRTPEGIVSFPFVSGIAYPETAILYKN